MNETKQREIEEGVLEICNRINAAIDAEKIVMANDLRIAGAFPNGRGIGAIPYGIWPRFDNFVPVVWIDPKHARTIRICTVTEIEAESLG